MAGIFEVIGGTTAPLLDLRQRWTEVESVDPVDPAAPEDKSANDYTLHSETWPGFEDLGGDGDTWRTV